MILIVDHDSEVLEKARDVLNHNWHVLGASSAEQALAMVHRIAFSVVLIDLELPGDALALIQELHEASPDLPIIAVTRFTATVKSAAFLSARSPGVIEVLSKPVSPAWKPVVERVRASGRRV